MGWQKTQLQFSLKMLRYDIKPDHVILTTLLSACSHAGLVDEGLKHFKSIEDVHGIELTMEHYACVVDLLSRRRGRLKEAYDFIKGMLQDPWGEVEIEIKGRRHVSVAGDLVHLRRSLIYEKMESRS